MIHNFLSFQFNPAQHCKSDFWWSDIVFLEFIGFWKNRLRFEASELNQRLLLLRPSISRSSRGIRAPFFFYIVLIDFRAAIMANNFRFHTMFNNFRIPFRALTIKLKIFSFFFQARNIIFWARNNSSPEVSALWLVRKSFSFKWPSHPFENVRFLPFNAM